MPITGGNGAVSVCFPGTAPPRVERQLPPVA
jgi:hypothetical protein